MQIDDIITIKINDVCFGGDGIGRSDDGMAVFVPFTALEDEVEVRITSLKKRFARAEVVTIVKPGKGRIEPVCEYYGSCGGCVYQHLDYNEQFELKKRQLQDILERIGGLKELPEINAFPSPKPLNYRNKLTIQPFGKAEETKTGPQIQYGFVERDSHTVFPLKKCAIIEESLNDMIKKIPNTSWGKQNAKRDNPRRLTFRRTADGETFFYVGHAPKKLPWKTEKLQGKDVKIPLESFWQINPAVASEMFKVITGWFADSPSRILIDSYAGVGPFSLVLPQTIEKRYLIECDELAMKAAEFNHQSWGHENVEIIAGKTEQLLPKLLVKLAGRNRRATVILDPPRTGCDKKVVKSLIRSSVKQLYYISCNPSTLARDLRLLCVENGFEVTRLAMFDMFPQTAHFETAVLLKRRKK